MRTGRTNFLQAVVLISGIIYLLTGALFLYSPIKFVEIFSIEVTEDWFRAIQFDTFIAPLYFLARSFAAMMLAAGLAMVLPLYDPLKYRGLVYYTGVIYPALAAVLLLYNGIKFDQIIAAIYGSITAVIFIATVSALILSKNEAKAGIE